MADVISGAANTSPWLGIGMGVANSILDQFTAAQQFNRQKQLMDIQNRNQQGLMSLQQQNQEALNVQGQQLQMKTWEETNYPAQVKMMEAAGLNPAMIYAKGGPGGTTGGQTGGSAAGGAAAMGQAPRASMDISNILAMQQMQEQIKLTEAQANKTNKEANVIGTTGIETAEAGINKMIAETQNEKLKGELIQVQTGLTRIQAANSQEQIDAGLANLGQQTNKLRLENSITTEAYDSIIKEIQAKAVGQTLENELTQAKTSLTGAEKQNIITGIVQKWTELSQGQQKIDLEAQKNTIDTFKANMEAENPGAMNVLGNVMKKAFRSLENLESFYTGGTMRGTRDEVPNK